MKSECQKCNELARLLVERIEIALEPWEVKPGEQGYDTAI